MTIECSLAIIQKSNQFLFSLRSKKPFINHYEFPGGKIEHGETPDDALERECFEELGIIVTKKNKIGFIIHLYNELRIKIHIYSIINFDGLISPKEKQTLSYLDPLDKSQKFIESTYRIINYMRLPRYLKILSEVNKNVISDIQSKDNAGNMVRLRSLKKSPEKYITQVKEISTISKNIKLILDAKYFKSYHDIRYDGLHYTSQEINNINVKKFQRKSKNITYSASCHNIHEINIANMMNLDFILLSPILKNKYDINSMGWKKFQLLSEKANMPVFALGGISKNDLETCVANNGYGVSGISNF